MEALLIEEWTGEADAVVVLDEASLSVIRERVRQVAKASNVATDLVDRAVLVATELGRNQLRHALAGRMIVTPVVRGAHRGLEITALDRGSGLVDAAHALDATRGPRAEGSLGVGVASVRRLSSEVDFDVRVGEGTRIKARLVPADAPRRREVGIYGRPHEHEKVSGDHGAMCRYDDALVLAVCDGLGHGPPARQAAHAAMKGVYGRFRDSSTSILEASAAELGATRGVVMAVVRIDEQAAPAALEAASIGNVELQVCGPRRVRRFGGSSAVLGARSTPRATKPRVESSTLAPNDLVILSTDGISSKLSIEDDLELLREHPIVVAQRIVERFGRANDDALVLVAR